MPNSIIQGLTTSPSMAGRQALNRLTAFETVTLIGLMSLVDPKQPHREVRTSPSKLLGVIEVSRSVAHAVERNWVTEDGEQHRRRYRARRFSPQHLTKINDAMITLFDRNVVVRRQVGSGACERKDMLVHLLDSFGYTYIRDGRAMDLHDLPEGDTVNVGTAVRPVLRLKAGARFARARWVYFRLNAELASEVAGAKGTLKFTLFARKVFALFRELMKRPTAIRLAILVLRQTGDAIRRRLKQLMIDLGYDVSHTGRSVTKLQSDLATLTSAGLLVENRVHADADRLELTLNSHWHKDRSEAERRPDHE